MATFEKSQEERWTEFQNNSTNYQVEQFKVWTTEKEEQIATQTEQVENANREQMNLLEERVTIAHQESHSQIERMKELFDNSVAELQTHQRIGSNVNKN